MKVVEKFVSINGEGQRAGELAVFIRFKGCNLACSYCDTAWANESSYDYENLSPHDILLYIIKTGVKNVTLTGGEPLLQRDMPALLELLGGYGDLRVEIETNGSVAIAPFCGNYRPVFTMDYKLPSSGCEDKMLESNYELLNCNDTVKFVVGSAEDLKKAQAVIAAHDLTQKCSVYFSPVFGMIEPSEIVDFMIRNNLNDVRLQLQLHKFIWNPDLRGV